MARYVAPLLIGLAEAARLMVGDRFTCTFCGGWFEAYEDEGALVHSYPACPAFERMEVDDFAAAVNDATFGKEQADKFRADLDRQHPPDGAELKPLEKESD